MLITAPNKNHISLFLAGSIEMGNADDWQKRAIAQLERENVIIYNPRREDWDSSWVQDILNSKFYEQVKWELSALDKADFILMHFEPDTMSPITLLELGLYASSGKLIVSCPKAFWRRGNVEIVCKKYLIPFFTDLDNMLDSFKKRYLL